MQQVGLTVAVGLVQVDKQVGVCAIPERIRKAEPFIALIASFK
jgi:hypothetical protein